MLEHEYLTRWECFWMKFWGKVFVKSCKMHLPQRWCKFADKKYWKQLRKVPK